GFPAESLAELFFAGYQDGGVAGAAWEQFTGDFAAGDFFGGVEDFEDGETTAVANVEGFAGDFFQGFEGADVGIGDVQDMDVVADAGAIGCGVVVAEDFELRNEA